MIQWKWERTCACCGRALGTNLTCVACGKDVEMFHVTVEMDGIFAEGWSTNTHIEAAWQALYHLVDIKRTMETPVVVIPAPQEKCDELDEAKARIADLEATIHRMVSDLVALALNAKPVLPHTASN